MVKFKTEMDMYMAINHILSQESASADRSIVSLQDYMAVVNPVVTQKSNIIYEEVLDAKSESRVTLMTILFGLHQRFIEKQGENPSFNSRR